AIAHERKGGCELALVERRCAEEIEVDGDAMPKLKSNGRTAVEDEGQIGCGSELRPDLPLRRRQAIQLRLKDLRHRTISAHEPAVSTDRWQATVVRARIPTTGRSANL